MTATPTTAASPNRANIFLEKYITDPALRQAIEAALTTGPGFMAAVQEYGGFKTPKQYAQEARDLYTRREGETALQYGQRKSQAARDYDLQREANYMQYKQPYEQLNKMVYDLRQSGGFASPEEQAEAQAGLQDIRNTLFGQYQSGRAVLEAQNKMREAANRTYGRRAAFASSAAGRRGMEDPFKRTRRMHERDLYAYNQAIQDALKAGALPEKALMTGGEALLRNMSDLASEARSDEWYEKERGVSTYNPETKITTPYSRLTSGIPVGVPGYTGGSSNLPQAQPAQQQTPTTAALPGPTGLNLGVGGAADVLNRKDIRAALQGGMSMGDIRRAVREGDIRLSAKAKARLF